MDVTGFVCLGVIVLFVVMIIAGLYNLIFGRKERLLEAQREFELASRNLSLTCKICGKLASPIPDTGNRYRCADCGNQFAGATHNLYAPKV